MLTGKQIRGLFFDYWWIAVLAILLLSLTVWLFSGEKSKKEDKLESNIDVQKGVNSVLTNQVREMGENVNAKANNTNKAIDDLRNTVARPANSFDGNRANERYCRAFPDDCK